MLCMGEGWTKTGRYKEARSIDKKGETDCGGMTGGRVGSGRVGCVEGGNNNKQVLITR